MSNKVEPVFDQRYLWSDLSSEYPDMWAFLIDVEYDKKGAIRSGVLVELCKFKDRELTAQKLIVKGVDYVMIRTTFNIPAVGVLYANIRDS